METIKGINITKKDSEIYFVRHGESFGNIGHNYIIDSPLTKKGIEQVQQLEGHYNLVICSPLRRTQETLHHSKITYDKLIINQNIRESWNDITSLLPFEQRFNKTIEREPIDLFWARVNHFTKELEQYCKNYKKILIIGHAYFFNGWFRRGAYPSPKNAIIYKLE